MSACVFILDQGTSVHKLLVFDRQGQVLETFAAPAPTTEHHPDGFGFDGFELLKISNELIAQALRKYEQRLMAFGFSNQGESVIAFDRQTGEPLSNVLSWQCQAADVFLAKRQTCFQDLRVLSGLVPSAYFSAAKIGHLFARRPALLQAARNGSLVVGTLDAWMIWHWTRGRAFVTDPTTACRTQFYDIHQLDWSDTLLDIFGVPKICLPKVCENSSFEVLCDDGPFKRRALPLLASLCDQPASLIGHGGLESPILKTTLGTGAFVDLSRADGTAHTGLLKSILYGSGGKAQYYSEGGVLSFSSAFDWLENRLGIPRKAAFDALDGDDDVMVLPAFSGLGAPHFRADIRTRFGGVGLQASPLSLAAATVRGLVFRVSEIIDAMATTQNLPDCVQVDGGASQDTVLMQFLADALVRPVVVQDLPEMTSLGVCRLVLDRLGEKLKPLSVSQRLFEPRDQRVPVQYQNWRSWCAEQLASHGDSH